MRKKIKTVFEKISRWNFNRKLALMIALLLVVSNLGILSFTSASAVRSLRIKSSQFAQAQLSTINQTLEAEIKNIVSNMESIAYNEAVQNYISYEENTEKNSLMNVNSVYQMLSDMVARSSLVDYVSIISMEKDSVLYAGEVWTRSDFKEQIMEAYESAVHGAEKNIRYDVMQKVFYPEEKVLNFFMPMNEKYDVRPDHPVAVLVVGVGENNLKKYLETSEDSIFMNVYLENAEGAELLSHESSGKRVKPEIRLEGSRGMVEKDHVLYMYQKLDDWAWYTISSIETDTLYRETRNTVFFLVAMIGMMCVGGIFLARSICRWMYRPMEEISMRMKEIAKGNLSTRIEKTYSGEDFQQLTKGFNSMAHHIQELMEQVRTEQHELEQSKLNALQSQIKPHFLYNILECIHWQALSQGNREVSRMVKALANYYRLCLSQGKDVITLRQELAHTKYYLIIQNIRYDNIVQEEVHVAQELEDILIPKMTLQPLVENSIYHGLKVQTGRKGIIRIEAFEKEDCCVVRVTDNGAGMSEEQCEMLNQTISKLESDKGYGLRNVHKRIEILFGKGYGLHYSLREEGGVIVDITLPRLDKTRNGDYSCTGL